MHKAIYGECRITLAITAQSLLLLEKPQWLRASSLKGIWRSGVERILRSFDAALACDPFDRKSSCSQRLEKEKGATVYGKQCPACRIFGSTAHAGLIHIDSTKRPSDETITKTSIAIDRITGGVRPPTPYKMEPIEPGSRFLTPVVLTNFDLWQIGLLALVWREMNEKALLVGRGGRKGMGEVSIEPTEISIRYPQRFYAKNRTGGTGAGLYSARYLAGDDTPSPDSCSLLSHLCPDTPSQSHWRDAGWVVFALKDMQQINEFFQGCVEQALAPRLQQGCNGFGYQPQEATNAPDAQKPL